MIYNTHDWALVLDDDLENCLSNVFLMSLVDFLDDHWNFLALFSEFECILQEDDKDLLDANFVNLDQNFTNTLVFEVEKYTLPACVHLKQLDYRHNDFLEQEVLAHF